VNWPSEWNITDHVMFYRKRSIHATAFSAFFPLPSVNASEENEAQVTLTHYTLGSSTVKFSVDIVAPVDIFFETDVVEWSICVQLEKLIISHKEELGEYSGLTTHKLFFTPTSLINLVIDPTALVDGKTKATNHSVEVSESNVTVTFLFPLFSRTLHYDPTVGVYNYVEISSQEDPISGKSAKSSVLYLLSLLSVLVAVFIVFAVILIVLWRERLKDKTWEQNVGSVIRSRVNTISIENPFGEDDTSGSDILYGGYKLPTIKQQNRNH